MGGEEAFSTVSTFVSPFPCTESLEAAKKFTTSVIA